MTSPFGIGATALGTTTAGYGTPSATPLTTAVIYRDEKSGEVYGSAKLDLSPVSKCAYVYDADGNKIGQPDGHQLVTLALATELGSCCIQTLGRAAPPAAINDSYVQDEKARVSNALDDLVTRGIVSIDSIDVNPNGGNPSLVSATITDNATGKVDTVVV